MSESSQTLRFGILGTAKITRRLVPAIREAANAELCAIASRTGESAKAWAQQYACDRIYVSYPELLAQPDIDAIYLPLPPSLHREWTIAAADAGKHVLCEKPLALTAADAEAMAAACAANGVQLMDGVMWVHHDRTPAMKRMIDSADFAPLRRVTAAFSINMMDELQGNFRLDPALGGGGLWDLGYYCVRAVLWAFAELPHRVYATARFEGGVDLNLSAIMWFDGDRMASIDCGFDTAFRTWMEVAGGGGSLVCDRFTRPLDGPTAPFYIHHGFDDAKEEIPNHDQIVRMIETFAASALSGDLDPRWPREAIDTVRLCEALLRSAHDGQAVELPAPA